MSDQKAHLKRAEESLDAAEALRSEHPAWSLVPLFYSALHLMHAKFDADGLPAEQRHPDQHKSYREGNGVIRIWGTLDVVRAYYLGVSSAYSQLFSASLATRYGIPPRGDCSRLWDAYEVIHRKV